MAREKDMTQGSPWKLILLFSLPLMLSNALQQVYTLVDTAVVGRFIGVEALASLGAADWLNWLVVGIPAGFAQGFGILFSHCFGAGDREQLRRAIAMALLLAAMISAVTLAVGEIFLAPVLRLLGTPENVMNGALTYLRIYFAGIPIIMAGSLLASLLRALGDSRTPLITTVVSSLVNVALDLLFTIAFGWGIPGVAVATLLAHTISALYCLRAVSTLEVARVARRHFSWNAPVSGELMRLGTPVALQNTIISAGGLCVQSVINSFGFLFIAGFTATNKLYGVLEMAAVSFGYAVATYTGQNKGAQRYTRIKAGVRSSAVMALITAAAISCIMLLGGRSILSIFISGEPGETAAVLEIAWRYLFTMCLGLPVLYMLYVYRSALQGLGDTLVPMISGFVELVMRVGAALLLPRFMGRDGVYLAEVCAWAGAAILLASAYYAHARRFPADGALRTAQRPVS